MDDSCANSEGEIATEIGGGFVIGIPRSVAISEALGFAKTLRALAPLPMTRDDGFNGLLPATATVWKRGSDFA
jgi:hypothetical protein